MKQTKNNIILEVVLKAHSGVFPGVVVLIVILEMFGELSAMELLP